MKSKLLFGVALAAVAQQAFAVSTVLNLTPWNPNQTFWAGDLRGIVTGSTAISDDQEHFSLVLTINLLAAELPGTYGAKLTIPVPGGDGSVNYDI